MKFLGVIINESLSWKPQISLILNKISKFITQSAFTFSKLTIDTLEQGVKFVQS